MALFITSLNSGSNGNCYYVGNNNEAILIDAGISCRETIKRMKRLNLPMQKIKAIFITHEHSDHIGGLETLSKKFHLPIYITLATEQFSNLKLQRDLVRRFSADSPVHIGSLSITAFQKEHDASDPHSFLISDSGIHVGVITDIGTACSKVIHHFSQCHAAFLESNYDEAMLLNGGYPWHLKRRISDGKGHLSNIEALALFNKHRSPFMTHLILSHLSKNNNTPEIVEALFREHAGSTQIIIASRDRETEVFSIDGPPVAMKLVRRTRDPRPQQLSLF